MSARSVIDSIARGAEKLIGENRRLRREVEKLEAARDRLRERNRELETKNAELERRVAVKELAAGFGGESTGSHGAKTARARVDRLLREVDKCMELIGKE